MRLLILSLSIFALLPAFAQGGSLSSPDSPPTKQNSAPDSFSALAKRLMPAVVNIQTQKSVSLGLDGFGEDSPLNEFNDFFNRDNSGARRQAGQGSGFFISADGYIVTNNHVVEGADQINIVLSDGREFEASLVGRDAETDIAVIKAQTEANFDFVNFGDSEVANVGDWVIAIGNPFGFGGSVTSGIISARNRDINAGRYDNFIQTDAAINQGNSGGPLFNLNGEVIGVNTAIISNTGGSIGLGFSVPSNMAEKISQALIDDGLVKRASLGASVQAASADLVAAYGGDARGGVIITSLKPDSPAVKGGLLVGDLILSFNGQPVSNLRAFTARVAQSPIGEAVDLNIIRDGKPQKLSVTLEQMKNIEQAVEETRQTPQGESVQNFAKLGLDLTDIGDADRRRYGIPRDIEGVIIRSVAENSPAFGKLRRGDVVTEIAFNVVFTMEDAKETLAAKLEAAREVGRPLLMRINRRGLEVFVSISLADD